MNGTVRKARALATLGVVVGMALLTPTAPVAAAPPAGPTMRVIDLGVMPGESMSTGWAINRHGDVVGDSGPYAVLWRHGRAIDLGGPGQFSSARDINDRGEIVGWSYVAGTYHAVLWRKGRAVDLGVLPGGTDSFAEAINDRGDIVGYSGGPDLAQRAVIWRGGRVIDLGPADVFSSHAYDVDERGTVVGEVFLPADPMNSVPSRWRRGTMSTLDSRSGVATATNDRGEVTGYRYGGGSVLWRRGAAIELEQPAGAVFMQAEAVNNRTQIVGTTAYDGFLWAAGSTAFLPRLPGGGNSAAFDINDRGQVTGTAATTSDGLNQHAVLWVPERS